MGEYSAISVDRQPPIHKISTDRVLCRPYVHICAGPALDIQLSPVRVYLAHAGQPGQAGSDLGAGG